MATPSTAFELFDGERTILLTTYEPEGTPVGGPTCMAIEGDRAFVRVGSRALRARHLERRPEAEIAPATLGGTPTGNPLKANARRLKGPEARHAARALARRHPFRCGLALLKPDRKLYYELRLIGE
jgi:PPOX class probable F420-dependent enzyme